MEQHLTGAQKIMQGAAVQDLTTPENPGASGALPPDPHRGDPIRGSLRFALIVPETDPQNFKQIDAPGGYRMICWTSFCTM